MMQDISSLEAALAAATKPPEKIQALNALARALSMDWLADRARPLAESALALAQQQHPPAVRGIADSLMVLSWCDFSAPDYGKAIERANQALNHYAQLGVADEWVGQAYYIQGLCYLRLGEYATALEILFSQLQITEKIADDFGQARALNVIGIIQSEQHDHPQAIVYFEKSLAIYRRRGDIIRSGSILNNLCFDHRRLGNWDTALQYGQECLAVFEEINDLNGQSRIHSNLGEIYLEQDNLAKAEFHHQRALHFANQAGGTFSRVSALSYLGPLYHRLGRDDDALAALSQGLQLAEENTMHQMIYQFHQSLAKIYEAQGDFAAALKHYREFHERKEAIFSEQNVQRVKNLEVLHQTQRALNEADTQKRLREQDRLYFETISAIKDDFLLTATHDLKNPLTSIMSTAGLIREYGRVDDARGQRFLSRIEAAAQQMRDLITDLLDLAKIETGQWLTVEMHDLVGLVRTAVEHFQEGARQQNITLMAEVRPADLTELPMYLDPRQMQQTLHNLLANALKFTGAGGCVTVRLYHTSEQAIMEVVDTGVGIPAEAIPHIFDRFYRVPIEAHERVEGTGLGLAIVKAIIEKHGGTIEVESVVGQGSTFRLRVPL